ncbi:hypothetical protein [Sodalis-like endosymbiont of Proechinophthirus fluctus]|uniref:hypothetical protein n=1 Tax=Sodalis-like endosymbiont of Proechinophthirus fluctus TaxID=1462730 RepID=UPI000A72F433|nr:hypothetical protein [Sodalis-like endosymbiont of Proechinophthirus fluctus]
MASALNGFVQIAGTATVSLSMMALPLGLRQILVIVIIVGNNLRVRRLARATARRS